MSVAWLSCESSVSQPCFQLCEDAFSSWSKRVFKDFIQLQEQNKGTLHSPVYHKYSGDNLVEGDKSSGVQKYLVAFEVEWSRIISVLLLSLVQKFYQCKVNGWCLFTVIILLFVLYYYGNTFQSHHFLSVSLSV